MDWGEEKVSEGKFSVNRACAAGAAFLGVISVTATAVAVLLTGNPAVVWLVLLFAALVLACAAAFVAFLRCKLVLFSDNLCQRKNRGSFCRLPAASLKSWIFSCRP